MTAERYDAIVLGTGGVGSAAMYQLANRGLRVLGLDRFCPGHDQGSSHGETRMIRLSYFEHADYVPLLKRAYQLWDQLDPSLLQRSGVYYVGSDGGEVIQGVRQSAQQHGLSIEQTSQAPPGGFLIPPGFTTLFEADAGFLPVEHCVRLHLSKAIELGAEHRWGDAVLGWEEHRDCVSVTTAEGRFEARRLIIAAGSWSAAILSDLGLPLRVLRKHLHWFEADKIPSDSGFFYDLEHGQFYGFPRQEGLIKIGEHSGGEPVENALLASREPSDDDSARIEAFLRDYLPGMGSAVRHAVCFYTMTPDGHFIVDKVPGSDRVAFAAGLSGHGFKFTPVLGEVLAELLFEEKTGLDIGFLSLDRLRE
jgi:sarcosine oxidase